MRGTAARRSSGVVLVALVATIAACSSSSPSSAPASRADTSVAGSSAGAVPSGSSSSAAPVGPGTWHLVGYDLKLHRIDVFDEQFKIVQHFSVPNLPSPFPRIGPGDTMVLTGAKDNVVIDLHSGKTVSFTLPSADEFPQYAPADAKVLAFTDADSRVSVLNLASGSVTDGRQVLGDPKAVLVPNGDFFPDAATFSAYGTDTKTLVVPYDGSAAYAVPGRVLALDKGTALTAGTTSAQTTRIAVLEGGAEKGSLTVDGDVRGGLLTGSTTATLVTDDGRVLSADLAHNTTTSLAALGGTDQLAIPVSGDRLLVGRPDEAQANRLIDDQGRVVATFAPVDGQAVWIGTGYRPIGAPCFITQAGTKPVVIGGDVSLRDAETGQIRAQLNDSAVLARTPDGCSAASNVSVHAEAALDGAMHKFPPFSNVVGISPDLKSVVASGSPRSGDPTGWAVVDVMSGKSIPVPAGVYTWVSGAAP